MSLVTEGKTNWAILFMVILITAVVFGIILMF